MAAEIAFANCRMSNFEGLVTLDRVILHTVVHHSHFGKWSLSKCRYSADRAQNLPGPAPHIWLTLFEISSKSVQLRRSYYRMREDHFCPVEYLQYRLFEPIITVYAEMAFDYNEMFMIIRAVTEQSWHAQLHTSYFALPITCSTWICQNFHDKKYLDGTLEWVSTEQWSQKMWHVACLLVVAQLLAKIPASKSGPTWAFKENR